MIPFPESSLKILEDLGEGGQVENREGVRTVPYASTRYWKTQSVGRMTLVGGKLADVERYRLHTFLPKVCRNWEADVNLETWPQQH